MPPINLTEGAIPVLSSGKVQSNDINPVLQIADLRLVNTDRHLILLSDGSFFQQGILATHLNDLVRSEKLRKGSIVRLTHFVCNLIQNRMIIIIVDLDVIREKCDPIGDPKHYPNKTNENVNSETRSSKVGQPMIQTVAASHGHRKIDPPTTSAWEEVSTVLRELPALIRAEVTTLVRSELPVLVRAEVPTSELSVSGQEKVAALVRAEVSTLLRQELPSLLRQELSSLLRQGFPDMNRH